jgi:KDO2-lipid IV(A) lauroyltransferase
MNGFWQAVMRWASRRHLCTLHRLGGVLGWLTWLASPTYRRRFQAFSAQAGLDAATVRRAVVQAGRMVAELPWLWLRPRDQALGPLVRWEGEALLEAALAEGRGVLMLTPHLGCFEITAQAVAERYGDRAPLTVLYRPSRQAWLSEVQRTARDRPGLKSQPTNLSGVRQLIRGLRRGEMVGLLPDQVPPEGMGVWAPFFGRPAYTMTLAARLVQQTGAAWLLVWAERLPRGRGYVLRFTAPQTELPPLPRPTGDAEADARAQADGQTASATALNAEMERLIRAAPHQYLWGYHRYKQPRGQAPAAAGATA